MLTWLLYVAIGRCLLPGCLAGCLQLILLGWDRLSEKNQAVNKLLTVNNDDYE